MGCLGTDHYFFDQGRGSGKFSNKSFVEAVNTKINCMEQKSVCRKTETLKKLFAAGAANRS